MIHVNPVPDPPFRQETSQWVCSRRSHRHTNYGQKRRLRNWSEFKRPGSDHSNQIGREDPNGHCERQRPWAAQWPISSSFAGGKNPSCRSRPEYAGEQYHYRENRPESVSSIALHRMPTYPQSRFPRSRYTAPSRGTHGEFRYWAFRSDNSRRPMLEGGIHARQRLVAITEKMCSPSTGREPFQRQLKIRSSKSSLHLKIFKASGSHRLREEHHSIAILRLSATPGQAAPVCPRSPCRKQVGVPQPRTSPSPGGPP